MVSQLEPGHDLEAVTALDESEDVLGDETIAGEALGVPAVGAGELEEDNVAHLVEAPVMFLKLFLVLRLKLTPFKGTSVGRLGVLGLVSLELSLDDTLEVCVSEEVSDGCLAAALHVTGAVWEGTGERERGRAGWGLSLTAHCWAAAGVVSNAHSFTFELLVNFLLNNET